MKFPNHGLVYDYSLEDGGVSRKQDDDDEEHKTGEVRERRGRRGKIGQNSSAFLGQSERGKLFVSRIP